MRDPRAKLTAEEQKRQAVLLDLMRVATSSLDMGEAFERVSKLVGELVPHDRISVALRPDEEDYLEVHVLKGEYEKGHRILDRGHRLPLADSTSGEAVLAGRPVLKRLPEEASNSTDVTLVEAGYRSVMAVPLRAEGRVFGTLNFGSTQAGFAERDLQIAQEVADHLASPIEHAYFGTRLIRQAEELRLLNEISADVYEAATINELFERAHQRLRELTAMEAGAALLLNEERQVLELAYQHDMPLAAIDSLRDNPLPVGKFIPGLVTERCRLIVVLDEADSDERELPPLRDYGVKSHVCIPLAAGGRALGVIGLIDRRPHSFSQSELALFATVGEQLGMALERARLMERQAELIERHRFLNEVMQIAVSTLDVRDVFDLMAEKVRSVIPFDWFYIALPVPGEDSFEVFAFSRSIEFPRVTRGTYTPHGWSFRRGDNRG